MFRYDNITILWIEIEDAATNSLQFSMLIESLFKFGKFLAFNFLGFLALLLLFSFHLCNNLLACLALGYNDFSATRSNICIGSGSSLRVNLGSWRRLCWCRTSFLACSGSCSCGLCGCHTCLSLLFLKALQYLLVLLNKTFGHAISIFSIPSLRLTDVVHLRGSEISEASCVLDRYKCLSAWGHRNHQWIHHDATVLKVGWDDLCEQHLLRGVLKLNDNFLGLTLWQCLVLDLCFVCLDWAPSDICDVRHLDLTSTNLPGNESAENKCFFID